MVELDDLDGAALRIVALRMRTRSGELDEDQASRLLAAELDEAADPLALLTAVGDVGAKTLGLFVDLLRRKPTMVLRALVQEFQNGATGVPAPAGGQLMSTWTRS